MSASKSWIQYILWKVSLKILNSVDILLNVSLQILNSVEFLWKVSFKILITKTFTLNTIWNDIYGIFNLIIKTLIDSKHCIIIALQSDNPEIFNLICPLCTLLLSKVYACLWKQWGSRLASIWWSKLIRIHIIFFHVMNPYLTLCILEITKRVLRQWRPRWNAA